MGNPFSPDSEENAERVVDAVTAGFDRLIAVLERIHAETVAALGHRPRATLGEYKVDLEAKVAEFERSMERAERATEELNRNLPLPRIPAGADESRPALADAPASPQRSPDLSAVLSRLDLIAALLRVQILADGAEPAALEAALCEHRASAEMSSCSSFSSPASGE